MLITIKIIIDVPKSHDDNYAVAIENIVEAARREFTIPGHDEEIQIPVTVYIKEISENKDL